MRPHTDLSPGRPEGTLDELSLRDQPIQSAYAHSTNNVTLVQLDDGIFPASFDAINGPLKRSRLIRSHLRRSTPIVITKETDDISCRAAIRLQRNERHLPRLGSGRAFRAAHENIADIGSRCSAFGNGFVDTPETRRFDSARHSNSLPLVGVESGNLIGLHFFQERIRLHCGNASGDRCDEE